jgi:hypothetical protein
MIYIEGPPYSVKVTQRSLTAEIARLEKEMWSEVVRVVPSLDRYIIGKICEKCKVHISSPYAEYKGKRKRRKEGDEGKREMVARASKEILEIVAGLLNYSRFIILPGSSFNRCDEYTIIEESVLRWRKEFPSVSIYFPDVDIINHCEVVQLRGDKKEVDKLFLVITKLSEEMELNNFQDTVSVFKGYYKHIIGKNEANFNKIRDETQTLIEWSSSQDGRIVVIGKQENVKKVIALFKKFQNELV